MSENAQSAAGPPFEALDFLYMPSRDVERDLAFFTEVIGGVLIFAIEAYGARVAQFRLSDGPPRLLLADHLGLIRHPAPQPLPPIDYDDIHLICWTIILPAVDSEPENARNSQIIS